MIPSDPTAIRTNVFWIRSLLTTPPIEVSAVWLSMGPNRSCSVVAMAPSWPSGGISPLPGAMVGSGEPDGPGEADAPGLSEAAGVGVGVGVGLGLGDAEGAALSLAAGDTLAVGDPLGDGDPLDVGVGEGAGASRRPTTCSVRISR